MFSAMVFILVFFANLKTSRRNFQIFKRANLFHADQNIEILWKIAKFFGTDDIQEYINKYKLTVDAEIEQRLHESK